MDKVRAGIAISMKHRAVLLLGRGSVYERFALVAAASLIAHRYQCRCLTLSETVGASPSPTKIDKSHSHRLHSWVVDLDVVEFTLWFLRARHE